MRGIPVVLAFAMVLAVGCAGDDGPADDDGDLLARLQGLPGVTVTEQSPVHAPPGYRYFVLQVTQPVDHDAPDSGATFQQRVSLIHVGSTAPMVAYTTGYDDYLGEAAAEPTLLLRANQISIEHRFFGSSRPAPAAWSALTIAQAAADEHAIIAMLKPLYHGAWISSGASKGGMTAIYHRRFYPDDVAGTVAYVAPQSFGIPDPRYAGFVDAVGPANCRTAVRAAVTEMMSNRRTALLQLAVADAAANHHTYTRIAIEPALESAIQDFEWTFWQYFGVNRCSVIPAPSATDQALWSVLQLVSPVGFSDDTTTARFEAYFYQAYSQLGSPGTVAIRGDTAPSYLQPMAQFSDADYLGALPMGVAVPTFDASAMRDVNEWVETRASHLILAYGEWDPWTGGKFVLGNASDSLELIQAQGTHGAGLAGLAAADRDAAFAKLAAWTGVTPNQGRMRGAAVFDPWPLRHGPAR